MRTMAVREYRSAAAAMARAGACGATNGR